MKFEDVAIAFSEEEWGLLDDAERLLYHKVMLEVFALVSSVGCQHKVDVERVFVEGESQVRALETATGTQKNHLCQWCFSVLKDILHLTELQAAYFEQNDFFSGVCVRDFYFIANPHGQQRDVSGEKPWKEDMDRASFVAQCSFYLSWLPSTSREVGKSFQALSEFLPNQATLNTEESHRGSNISQELLSRKSLQESGQCEKAISHSQKIVQHQGVCSGEVNYECNKRGKLHRLNFNLIRRERVHTGEKPYVCSDCGKSFTHNCKLNQHRRVHTGEKPFKCSHCGKFFRETSHLVKHRRIHTGEKPYECSDCGKFFRQRSHLIKHHRVHIAEKPYECSDCGKSFKHICNLTEHQRVHTGEKPYECSDCGRSFRQNSKLIRHRRVHTGQKPYECSDCEWSFRLNSKLIQHRRVHTGESPHECSECGKSFTQKCNLVKHLRIHTAAKP